MPTNAESLIPASGEPHPGHHSLVEAAPPPAGAVRVTHGQPTRAGAPSTLQGPSNPVFTPLDQSPTWGAAEDIEEPDDGNDLTGSFRSSTQSDFPMDYRTYVADEHWIAALGLPQAVSERHRLVRACVLASALRASRIDAGRWVSYARTPGWYAARRRYLGQEPTKRTVIAAVDDLVSAELIENRVAEPTSYRHIQSTLRASERLRRMLPPFIREKTNCETLFLKDAQKKLVNYADTDQTRRWRLNLRGINEAIRAAHIAMPADLTQTDGQSLRFGDRTYCCVKKHLYRVFNGDWNNGGRFYGGWWLSIPKELRTRILIDGAATVELDFPQMHPRLLYEMIGMPLARNMDAYRIEGQDRKTVKRAFNIAINSRSEHAAWMGIANMLVDDDRYNLTSQHYVLAHDLLERIKLRHPAILAEGLFFSGAGTKLQRLDSEIAESILLSLLGVGISCLPIHDSFIVKIEHGAVLDSLMSSEFEEKARTFSL
jgi:hypothetical protein